MACAGGGGAQQLFSVTKPFAKDLRPDAAPTVFKCVRDGAGGYALVPLEFIVSDDQELMEYYRVAVKRMLAAPGFVRAFSVAVMALGKEHVLGLSILTPLSVTTVRNGRRRRCCPAAAAAAAAARSCVRKGAVVRWSDGGGDAANCRESDEPFCLPAGAQHYRRKSAAGRRRRTGRTGTRSTWCTSCRAFVTRTSTPGHAAPKPFLPRPFLPQTSVRMSVFASCCRQRRCQRLHGGL